MNFAQSLASYQQRLNLTQPAMAHLLEISPRVLFDWLKGKGPVYRITEEGALARLEKAAAMQGA